MNVLLKLWTLHLYFFKKEEKLKKNLESKREIPVKILI